MKEKLSLKDTIFLSSMLFGMFFGAGNLIFPIYAGNQAGREFFIAIIGFCISAVLIPLLGIIVMGVSKYEGLTNLQDKVGKTFGTLFTTALYLSCGPLFAIPRAITVSFTLSLEAYTPIEYRNLASVLFSFLFFNIVVFFSLRPKKLVMWIGKLFNPFFLLSIGILVTFVFIHPPGEAFLQDPSPSYAVSTFFKGGLEGYNTLDVIASLAFGAFLVESIHNMGVKSPKETAKASTIIGFMTFTGITITYFILGFTGSVSRPVVGIAKNGGEALQLITSHYFGMYGSLFLGAVITFACLKTAISLVTASSFAFEKVTNGKLPYSFFAIVFSLTSFLLSNIGLTGMIRFTIPFIVFLYPILIMIIFLLFVDGWLDLNKYLVRLTLYLTAFFALIDAFRVISISNLSDVFTTDTPISLLFGTALKLNRFIPFFNLRLSWVFFGISGLFLSILYALYEKVKKRSNIKK